MHLGGVGEVSVAGVGEVGGAAKNFLLHAEHVCAIIQVDLMRALVFVERSLVGLVMLVKFSRLRLRQCLGLHLAVGVMPCRRERNNCAESDNDSQQG